MEEALRADLRDILGTHVDLSRAAEWLGKGYDPGMVREVIRDLRGGNRTLRRWPISTRRLPIGTQSGRKRRQNVLQL